jgi:hypothetical protein
MSTPDQILEEGAELFRQRNAIYGNGHLKVGKIMAALFPEGIKLESSDDHLRFHIFMLAVVKLTRYSENFGKGGHADSVLDLSVYAAMLSSIDETIEENDWSRKP